MNFEEYKIHNMQRERIYTKCLFIGSKHLGLSALQQVYKLVPESLLACVTIDDTTDIRSKLLELRSFCAEQNIPLEILKRPSELMTTVKKYEPDFCLVVGWYWILKPDILSKVPHGFLGIHASLLPRYRGGAPLVWPIINGDSESGITLFYFDTGMDTGDIVGQKRFVIGKSETVTDILMKADFATSKLLEECFPLLVNGCAPRRQQDHSQATYCSVRRPEDGHINWNISALQVYNFIRAQTHPYPGAFCFREDGQKIRVWSARMFPYKYYGIPGMVNQHEKDGVVVSCRDNAVVLKEVQLEGEQVKQAAQVLVYGEKLK